MTISVRPATREDADLLARLAEATFSLACPPGTRQEDIELFLREILSPECFAAYLADPVRSLLVAELSGVPAGYTMLVAEEPADPDVAAAVRTRPVVELSKCYVLPEHHGGGVAAQLVEASLLRAHELGAAAVWLGVNQRNARANRFYEKCGFHVVGEKRFRVGSEVHDDFVRERPLAERVQRRP